MLAYVGPESVAPIASAIAAFFGFLLLFWRKVISVVKQSFRFVFRIKVQDDDDHNDDTAAIDGPEEVGANGTALPTDATAGRRTVPQDQAS